MVTGAAKPGNTYENPRKPPKWAEVSLRHLRYADYGLADNRVFRVQRSASVGNGHGNVDESRFRIDVPKSSVRGNEDTVNEIRDIHKPLIQWLRANHLPYINHRPDVKSGIRSGWPDFSIFLAERCLFLEAKTSTGVVSPKQWLCIADLERAGNLVKIVRSASEAISAVMKWAGVEKAAEEAPLRSECPLDNERAAELIAAATNLSGDESESPKVQSIQQGSSPSQNLWIGDFMGRVYVFTGEQFAGGTASIVRMATLQDLRDLPRK